MRTLLLLALGTVALQANPDLFRESFADPTTRPAAIAMLTPGTRDHYFHSALDHQLSGREKEYQQVIAAWRAATEDKRNPIASDGIESLEMRQILKSYDRDPKAALADLRLKADLDFEDARPDSAAEEKALPTRLDPSWISVDAFRKEAATQRKSTPYSLYSPQALYAELDQLDIFSETQVRWFIDSFNLTQHPKYVALVAKALALKPAVSIDKINLAPLTLTQMDALRQAVPAVLSNQTFNVAYLKKSRPATPKELNRNLQAHAAFLTTCRDYALTLPASQNDLKAHIFYHYLRLREILGNHPKADFLTYLALPRQQHAIILPNKESKSHFEATSALSSITQCDAVTDDSALVESYLKHFLAVSDTIDKDLVPLLQEKPLAILHARTRILAGADPKIHAARLAPDDHRELREETRINFAPSAPLLFSSSDQVSLPLDLKNTPSLLIRIYELHSKPANEQVDASTDLDGLVPHHSRSLSFTQTPAVLHRETISLPELDGAGTWIVEFVSGSISARTLIRKGSITPYLIRNTTGQEVRLFDEHSQAINDFTLDLGSETFTAKDGLITVPNSAEQARCKGSIRAGKLTESIELGSRSDQLRFEMSFHLDREQLIANQTTTLRLRSQLTNHGQPMPLDQVKNATLVLKAVLLGGVVTERVIADPLTLAETNEIPFLVPADLLSLTITASGTVDSKTSDKPATINQSQRYSLNGALLTDVIGTALFSPTADGYRLELRGRNGEALPHRPISLGIRHRQYQVPIELRLRTDDAGHIALGALKDIEKVIATSSSIASVTFTPPTRQIDIPGKYTIAQDRELRIPMSKPSAKIDPASITLHRIADCNDYKPNAIENLTSRLTAKDAQLVIRNLAPGHYRLMQDDSISDIEVLPADSTRGNLFVTAEQILPVIHPATPTIGAATALGKTLAIEIKDASPQTRVTVIGKRYESSGWSPGTAAFPYPGYTSPKVRRGVDYSSYLTDRRLSDEVRYILDRRSATTFPGVMLPRPGQLLHRWTPDDLDQDNSSGSDGGDGSGYGGGSDAFSTIPSAMRKRKGQDSTNTQTTLDFLGLSSAVEFNLKPDAQGKLQIPLGKFEGAQCIEIIAADTHASDTMLLPLPASDTPLRDRRLARPLPADSHHIATRSAAALAPGAQVEIQNLLDADWRAFTTLGEAYQFLLGTIDDDRLRDFSFLSAWPTLSEKEKLEKLADHHCHELHLFLARKDRSFFDQHIKPLLAAKPQPQFIDDYLLGRDLNPYLRPFAFARLNAAEKALLAQSLPAAQKDIARELDLRWQLEAPSPDAETVLFSQTLKGADLSSDDSLGLASNRSEANRSGDAAIARNDIDAVLNNPNRSAASNESSSGAAYSTEKLRRIIIPRIDFEDVTLEEALHFLRARASELDSLELDPAKKGINIVSRGPAISSLRIPELKLRNVPLAVAIKYICDATKMRYKVDDYAVTLIPQTECGEDLFTRSFTVPPDFQSKLMGADTGSAEPDPFADPGTTPPQLIQARAPMSELLKMAGINLPEGASATLSGNTLLVTNTPTELDKIDQLTSTIDSEEPKQVKVTTKDTGSGLLPDMDQVLTFPDRTRLWLESNYYHYQESTDEEFIPLNRFWLELATWNGKGPFTSPHFNACTHNANDALMCLAMLDLPFTAKKPDVSVDGNTLKVKALAPMLLFYKDTRETDKVAAESPLLVRQSYHPLAEPFLTVNGKQIENTHIGDFRTGTAYGVSLVITNPSGIERRIETLAQIPAGSIPLATCVSPPGGTDPMRDIATNAPATLSTSHDLPPYGVIRLELAFYFPSAGDYTAYPLHVSENGIVLAHAQARTLRVSAEPAPEDSASWQVVARDGSAEAVLSRLSTENLGTIDLDAILWRLHDRGFFLKATTILRQRLHFDEEVFAYAILHNDPAALSDLIENSELAELLGSWFNCKLISINPSTHHDWQILEFDPLVNARAHPFGENPRLSHTAAREHYQAFLDTLAWKPSLNAADQLTFTCFLFLQDRVDEALKRFATIDPATLPDRMQYDYLHAVALFHQEKSADAKALASPYIAKLPAGIWKDRFAAVIAQADEIARPVAAIPDQEKDTSPTLEITQQAQAADQLVLKHSNLTKANIRLYHIDLEVLFSKDPFLNGGIESSLPPIAPNRILEVIFEKGSTSTVQSLPEEFRNGNILVAVESEEVKQLKILDSQALEVRTQTTERTIQVIDPTSGKPLPKTYIKVYAESNNGAVDFHKDGYTDMRGKFDFLSHTAKDPSQIRRLAILISHPEKGSRTLIIDR